MELVVAEVSLLASAFVYFDTSRTVGERRYKNVTGHILFILVFMEHRINYNLVSELTSENLNVHLQNDAVFPCRKCAAMK